MESAAAAGLSLALVSVAHGQDWQFGFDACGNLLTETVETVATPLVLGQPQTQVVGRGELASFFVVLANSRDLSYQWRFNGTNLSGATKDTLLLLNVGATDEGPYSVVVTNTSGSVTSSVAQLYLDSDRDGLADSWELAYFGNLTSQGSSGDADGDGLSNLDEFGLGTNPTNSASAMFRLTLQNYGGSVTASPAKTYYTNSEMVMLTAAPVSPGLFYGWTGDILTRSNTATVTMDANKTAVANFFPLDFVWTNLAGGDWNVPSNWSPNFAPSTNENASITMNVTVTVNSATECGSLTLGNASSTPTLSGSGTLTISGACLWPQGTMSGSGRTIIGPGATFSLGSGSGGVNLYTRTLENAGNAYRTGAGGFLADYGAVITNRVGALFEAQNNALFYWGANGAVPRFDNAGTFRKTTGTGSTTFNTSFAFNNYGAVEVQSGTLVCSGTFLNNGSVTLSAGTTNRIAAGGSGSGTFTAPATALVEWTGGTFTLGAGGLLNGAGLYQVNNSAVLTLNATLNVQNLNLVSSAGLGGSGTVTVGNLMNWTGGYMTDGGRTVIAPGATLNLGSGGGVSLYVRTLENAGTALWTGGGGFLGDYGAVITNRVGALFEAQNNALFFWGANGARPRFDNAGTFRKTTATGTTTFNLNVAFANYGTMDIRSGIVSAGGGYTSSSGALLSCAIGGTTAGTGYGQLQVAGTVTLNGALGVSLANGFYPAPANTFTVLTAGTRSGTFANFYYPSNVVGMQLSNSTTSVIVRVSNVAPVITGPANQTIHAGVSLSVNATATDADSPAQTLAFEKVSGPASLAVGSAGLITWPTTETDTGTTNPVSVRVFDNGSPSLSSTGAFQVVVVSRPVFLQPEPAGPDLRLIWTAISNTTYRLEFEGALDVSNWAGLAGDVISVSNTASKLDSLTSSNRLYRVRVLP
jgi:hypothetical protein